MVSRQQQAITFHVDDFKRHSKFGGVTREVPRDDARGAEFPTRLLRGHPRASVTLRRGERPDRE